MEFKILFKVSRSDKNIKSTGKSTGEGELTEDNFAEMVEEIKRWLDVGGKVEILEIEEL